MIQLIIIRISRAFAQSPLIFYKIRCKTCSIERPCINDRPFSIIRPSTGSEYDFQTFEYRIYCAINIFVYSMVVLHKY